MELNVEEFLLGNVLDAVISQVMMLLKEKNLQLVCEIPEEIKTLPFFGDQIKLQQVLSDFLHNIVQHAQSSDGWIEIKISTGLKMIQDFDEFVHLQFRMTHIGQGLPHDLIQDMFEGGNQWTTQEGLGLNLSRKLLSAMNGRVQYVRELGKCYFLIDIDLKTRRTREKGKQIQAR